VFADCQNKRIFYRISAESSSQLDHLLFSEERLERQINEVLSDVLEKILEDREMNRHIREVLRQS
ncbi:MAG: YajG family lipoprotein, partial [Syntrophaceae bacterium]|nr:YajG family lipoprotein [Syntrophaceae bacterium]